MTRRLGLARSRAQPAPTPAVVKRPEDAAAAAVVSADSEAAAVLSVTDEDKLQQLMQQALVKGLFVPDPQMVCDALEGDFWCLNHSSWCERGLFVPDPQMVRDAHEGDFRCLNHSSWCVKEGVRCLLKDGV